MAVLKPVKVVITNFPDGSPIPVTVQNIPGNDEAGTHTVLFDRQLWIEMSDFSEVMCDCVLLLSVLFCYVADKKE